MCWIKDDNTFINEWTNIVLNNDNENVETNETINSVNDLFMNRNKLMGEDKLNLWSYVRICRSNCPIVIKKNVLQLYFKYKTKMFKGKLYNQTIYHQYSLINHTIIWINN